MPEQAPFPQPFTLAATDGFPLGAFLFDPAARSVDATGSAPRALVLILGATGVRQRYYRDFAGYLASRGFLALTFDYRGIGASRPERFSRSLRGFTADMMDWGTKDVGGALAWAREHHPDLPLALVGHSFGGQAFGLPPEIPALRAGVHVAAQSGYFRHWSRGRWKLAWLWYVTVPAVVRIFGYLPRWLGLGEDLPRGVAAQWARWCRTPRYLVPHVAGAAERYRALRIPLLAWSFEDDGYAPRPAVEALLARFENARVEHRHLQGDELPGGRVGHFGFFRTGATEVLWERTADWLDRALREGTGPAANP